MNRFLTLKRWTNAEIVSCAVAGGLLLVLGGVSGLMSGAVAGIFGGLLLRHMALHGWTLARGTISQRAALACLWVVAIVAGGVMSTAAGF